MIFTYFPFHINNHHDLISIYSLETIILYMFILQFILITTKLIHMFFTIENPILDKQQLRYVFLKAKNQHLL